MAKLKAVNVTKVQAGGSGDNYVKDGFIKTVEKVWIDTYVLGAITTADNICIARLPAYKKLVDVIVHWPATGADNLHTTATVSLHLASDTATLPTGGAGNLGKMRALTVGTGDGGTIMPSNSTSATLQLNATGFLATAGTTDLGIWLHYEITGGAAIKTTGGTVGIIVRYT